MLGVEQSREANAPSLAMQRAVVPACQQPQTWPATLVLPWTSPKLRGNGPVSDILSVRPASCIAQAVQVEDSPMWRTDLLALVTGCGQAASTCWPRGRARDSSPTVPPLEPKLQKARGVVPVSCD